MNLQNNDVCFILILTTNQNIYVRRFFRKKKRNILHMLDEQTISSYFRITKANIRVLTFQRLNRFQ